MYIVDIEGDVTVQRFVGHCKQKFCTAEQNNSTVALCADSESFEILLDKLRKYNSSSAEPQLWTNLQTFPTINCKFFWRIRLKCYLHTFCRSPPRISLLSFRRLATAVAIKASSLTQTKMVPEKDEPSELCWSLFWGLIPRTRAKLELRAEF